MGWNIPGSTNWNILGIIGLILCIAIWIIYIVWTKSKEGFTTPTPPAFVCPTGTKEIPCFEGKAKCCEPTDPYERVYIGVVKGDSDFPVAATPITRLQRDISGTVEYKDDIFMRNAYEAYAVIEAEYDLSSAPPISETPPVEIPDFAIALGAFDSDVSTIPWDSDNATSMQSDVMWGYVSPQCSMSIWNRAYAENLFATTKNLQQNGNSFTYKSPLLGITINDPIAAAADQVGEFLAFAAIEKAVYSKRATKIYQAGKVNFSTAITKVNRTIGAGVKR
jgi:hypothetical protein